ncbi:MAG: hypothetical protein MJ009_05655 [Paludibacteraceae bacterium]|nr:hypothetical protein [Paludibacteraceae bacterium]
MKNYPATLIPIPGWERLLNIDKIRNSNIDFPIVRRISGIFKQNRHFFIEVGQGVYHLLLDANLPEYNLSSIADLSMNIISDECSIEDSMYRHNIKDAKGNDIDNWNGERVLLRKYKKCLHCVDPCYFIALKASNIHNQTFTYERQYADIKQYNKDKESIDTKDPKEIIIKAFSSNDLYKVNGVLKLKHSPTKLNYWHTVLKTYAPKHSKGLKKIDSRWKQDVAQQIFESILRKNIWINELPCKCLSSNEYENKEYCKIRRFIERIFIKIQTFILSAVLVDK